MAEERRETEAASEHGMGELLSGLLAGGGAEGMMSGLGSVLSDPQMMAKLPDVIAMLKPMMGALSGGEGGAGATEVPVSASPAVSVSAAETREPAAAREEAPTRQASVPVPSSGGGAKGCHDRRVALLCAIRPYLSPRRREAIDYILRMDRMGKLFRGG